MPVDRLRNAKNDPARFPGGIVTCIRQSYSGTFSVLVPRFTESADRRPAAVQFAASANVTGTSLPFRTQSANSYSIIWAPESYSS